MEWLLQFNPVLLALLATFLTWGFTALGSSMVFFFKTIDKRILNAMMGLTTMMMLDVALG